MPQRLNPPSTASIAGHPLHVLLVPIPIACFVGTLITDIVYWQTANMQWANFSAWLLAIGLLVAVLAVIAGLVDFLFSRRIRDLRDAWIHMLGNAVVIVLETVNSFIHSRDAYTSVMPSGLILSLVCVLILVVTSWYGSSLVHKHGVGVAPEGQP